MKHFQLLTAMSQIQRYFEPLSVRMKVTSPQQLQILLIDSETDESILAPGIPFTTSVTQAQLFEMIRLIEARAEAAAPGFLEQRKWQRTKAAFREPRQREG